MPLGVTILDCSVVVLSFYDDSEYVQEARRLGAVDYVLKTQLDDEKIVEMLQCVTHSIREGKRAPEISPRDKLQKIGKNLRMCFFFECRDDHKIYEIPVDNLPEEPRECTV